MLGPRWRKVLSDLWLNKARTVLVVLSIGVGVFAVGAILATRIIVQRDLTTQYQARNPADSIMFFGSFDERLMRTMHKLPEVADVGARRYLYVEEQAGPDEWVTMQIYVIPDFERQTVDIVEPEEGAWPPRRREILIERLSMRYANAIIGQPIRIRMDDGREYELQVVGTTHDMHAFEGEFFQEATGYVSRQTAEWLGAPPGFNQLHMTFVGEHKTEETNTETALDIFDRLVLDGSDVDGVWVLSPGRHEATDTVEALLLVLGALGGLALLLSGFLVVNTVTAIMAQQKRQIGMMKIVGAQIRQVVQLYVMVVAIFGLLALTVSVPVGVLGAWWLANFVASQVNFDITSLNPSPQVVGVQIGVALVVPVIAAMFPILATTRASVREAVSDYGINNSRYHGWFDRLLGRLRGLPRPMLLSLRNTFRRRGRLVLTLSTLSLAGAIFISAFCVRDSLAKTLDASLAYWGYDVEVHLGGTYRRAWAEREVGRVPGITAVESWLRSGGFRVLPDGKEGQWLSLYGIPAETIMIEPIMLEGRWLRPDDRDAIVINSEFLKYEQDIQIGDEITLSSTDSWMFKQEMTFQVVGFAQGLMTGSIGYVNYPYLARTVKQVGKVDRVLAFTEKHTPDYREQMVETLEERMRRAGVPGASVYTTDQERAMIEYQFSLLVTLLLVMVALLALVGCLGLMGTVGINVLERTREIGVMRAIGATGRAVRRIIIVEAVVIGLISWLIGLLLALPLSRVLSNAIGVAFVDDPLRYTFSAAGMFMWLAAAIALGAVSSFLPAYRASRLSVREALSYE